MHANDLNELATTIERRATRALQRCAGVVVGGYMPDREQYGELCRKAIADELQSEWLRMHATRRLKRPETLLLIKVYGQLSAAVQEAIAGVEPADMPAAACAAIAGTAAPRRRR